MNYGWARTTLNRLGLKVVRSTKKTQTEWETLSDEDKKTREKILVDKLDGARQFQILEGFFWSANDVLTGDRSDLSGTLILELKAYHDAFGVDGQGTLGGYTSQGLYDKVARYLDDLSYLKEAKKDLRDDWRSIPSHRRNLRRLKKYYQDLTGEFIEDRQQLELLLRKLILQITPRIKHEIATMMTLTAGRGGMLFDQHGRVHVPRYAPRLYAAEKE